MPEHLAAFQRQESQFRRSGSCMRVIEPGYCEKAVHSFLSANFPLIVVAARELHFGSVTQKARMSSRARNCHELGHSQRTMEADPRKSPPKMGQTHRRRFGIYCWNEGSTGRTTSRTLRLRKGSG